jgi:hypothetical protein
MKFTDFNDYITMSDPTKNCKPNKYELSAINGGGSIGKYQPPTAATFTAVGASPIGFIYWSGGSSNSY